MFAPRDIRNLLKEHRQIAQEGMPYVRLRDGTVTLPIYCSCGEGQQSFWNNMFNHDAWLDHFEVVCLDAEDLTDNDRVINSMKG